MIYPFSPDLVRRLNPDVSFPSELSDETLAEYGVFAVYETVKPEGEIVAEGLPELVNGEWLQTWTVSEFSVAQRKAMVAARRYQEETKGTTVNGMPVDTDRQSQALITGAALAATIDPDYVCRWKTRGGFIALDAAAIIAVATAVRNHVQGCFDREAELIAAIEEETYTSDMIDEGWPV